jgi:hypothetical protein
MSDFAYKVIRGAYRLATGFPNPEKVIVGLERLPKEGPAVFVANHLQSRGPTVVASALPLRLYPWAVWQDFDLREAPGYVRVDFVENEMGIYGLPGKALSYGVGLATVIIM